MNDRDWFLSWELVVLKRTVLIELTRGPILENVPSWTERSQNAATRHPLTSSRCERLEADGCCRTSCRTSRTWKCRPVGYWASFWPAGASFDWPRLVGAVFLRRLLPPEAVRPPRKDAAPPSHQSLWGACRDSGSCRSPSTEIDWRREWRPGVSPTCPLSTCCSIQRRLPSWPGTFCGIRTEYLLRDP